MQPSRSDRLTATVTVRDDAIGVIDRRLFGSFVEHMGRAVYTGVFEPGHPTADADGLRGDVLELVRELGATVVRYPGGNFVSGYRWEDGVGPRESRPTRLDAAWHSVETNAFGLHEFAAWAARADVEIMQAVNLGTRGIASAAELVEYCNHPGGTTLSERRRANGADEPFGIRLWCLGNEMDGPWQIGHRTALEYGRVAAEAARLMRFIDPDIELVVAGSSSAAMPTFGEWERTVLRETAGLVDHISVHAYDEEHDDVAAFLAAGPALDEYLDSVAAIIDEVEREHPPTWTDGVVSRSRRIGISVDEWNVWNQTRFNEVDKTPLLTGPWQEAPRIIEDVYTVTDAVVVGQLLHSLLRHADRVTMANLAQLVNVIAPIRTEPGGAAWRQTTFFPFQLVAANARGEALVTEVDGDVIDAGARGEAPAVDAVATREGDRVVVFVAARDLGASTGVRLVSPVADARVVSALVLASPDGDRLAVDDGTAQPVVPRELDVEALADGFRFVLPPVSWAMVVLEAATS